MSYNLLAEGDIDLFELGQRARQYEPLELFPIPADHAWGTPTADGRVVIAPDALGIALPSSRTGAKAAMALRSLVESMWAQGARVFDLYSGEQVSTPPDLARVLERIGGQ